MITLDNKNNQKLQNDQTPLPQYGSRHIVFADLAFAWVHGQTEISIDVRNLFNHSEFNYTTNNDLIDTSTMNPLRPASVFLKVRFGL